MPLFSSLSYLVADDLWLVMEYVDGGTLTSVLVQVLMEETMIAAISREVRDPACVSSGQGGTGVTSCSELLFQCCCYEI